MKKWLSSMVLGIGVAALIGCGGTAGSGTAVDTAKVWTVGSNATFVPFEFTDENHQLAGYDIELIRAIADLEGVKLEIKNHSFDGLIPALNSGQLDMAVSGMTITPARKEVVDFSIPYYQSGLGILIAEDSALATKEDLAGKKVAVQIGTTGYDMVSTIPNTELRTFDSNAEALLELKKGGADAVVADLPVIQYYLSTTADSHLKIVEIPLDHPEYFGIAFPKGKSEIRERVNSALKKMKANGQLDELYEKYFHEKAPVMPEE